MPTTAAADPDSFCTVIVSWAGRRGRQSVSKGLSGGQQRSHLAPEKSTAAHSLHTRTVARLHISPRPSLPVYTLHPICSANRARIHASLLPAASPRTCSGPALWAISGARGGTRATGKAPGASYLQRRCSLQKHAPRREFEDKAVQATLVRQPGHQRETSTPRFQAFIEFCSIIVVETFDVACSTEVELLALLASRVPLIPARSPPNYSHSSDRQRDNSEWLARLSVAWIRSGARTRHREGATQDSSGGRHMIPQWTPHVSSGQLRS